MPLTKILNEKLKEFNLKLGHYTTLSYEINNHLMQTLDLSIFVEKNIGRHWYETTNYKGTLCLYDLSLKLKIEEVSKYKF